MMKAKLKFLRVGQQDEENTLILRNMLKEEEAPYLFRVGDQIHITEDSEIVTIRRNDKIKVQFTPSMQWLENRLKELHWKIRNSLQHDGFISQSDVYERNYLMEIQNTALEHAKTIENNNE